MRILSITSLLLLITVVCEAQTHYTSQVFLGAKGGIETSQIFFNPSIKQKLPIGAVSGIMIRYVEERHFGLVAELNFVQRGWEENYESKEYSYRRILNYIEIPIMAHIYFGRRGKFFANVGPEVSFLISESTKSNFDYHNLNTISGHPALKREYSELIEPIQNKVDFGICAGLGGEFSINPRNSLALEARFYYGIGNIYKAGHRDPFRASNGFSFGLTAGYWFKLK